MNDEYRCTDSLVKSYDNASTECSTFVILLLALEQSAQSAEFDPSIRQLINLHPECSQKGAGHLEHAHHASVWGLSSCLPVWFN